MRERWQGEGGTLRRPRRASDPSWGCTGWFEHPSSNHLLLAQEPLRVGGGHEEALPIDGRAGVAAWVVADAHMALVQLHCDVVIVPVVQQDPIVLCRGDLMGNGTFSPTPSHTAGTLASWWGRWETTVGREMLCAELYSPACPGDTSPRGC